MVQDLLIYALKGLGSWAHLAAQNGVKVPQEIQSFITGATFSTLTNGKSCTYDIVYVGRWLLVVCLAATGVIILMTRQSLIKRHAGACIRHKHS